MERGRRMWNNRKSDIVYSGSSSLQMRILSRRLHHLRHRHRRRLLLFYWRSSSIGMILHNSPRRKTSSSSPCGIDDAVHDAVFSILQWGKTYIRDHVVSLDSLCTPLIWRGGEGRRRWCWGLWRSSTRCCGVGRIEDLRQVFCFAGLGAVHL